MNRSLATLPDFASATDFSASTAKAKLGEVIDLVAAGGFATITRRGRQRFAVLKLETVEALVAAAKDQELEALGNRYDELVARMQTPAAQAAADSLFTVSGEEMGATAVANAKPSATAAKQSAAARVATKKVAKLPAEPSPLAKSRASSTKERKAAR